MNPESLKISKNSNSTQSKGRLLAISPCRNEAKYLYESIPSVLEQTLLPAKWVIVDDGSSDKTPAILEEFKAQNPLISVIHKSDRGARHVGGGVVETFCLGLNSVNWREYDYICKLDLDLKLPKKYFEILIGRMDATPRLGTCSGKAYFYNSKRKLTSEKCGDEMSQGMTKLYRTKCFEEIGGFVPQVMWDGIDCHRCRMLGWIAASWDEPDLNFIHLRPMGSSEKGILTGRMRHGYGQYFMGTGLLYMMISSLYRMARPPYILGGLAILAGYLKALFQQKPRYEDPEFRQFLKTYQWDCLIKGKKRATEELEKRQEKLWMQNHEPSNRSCSDGSRRTYTLLR
jgi:glycosyltransferase involved in cell wall biosynthesis